MTRATVAMWAFAAGLAIGLNVAYLEATVHQYVRAPGSPVVVRNKRRKRT